MFFDGVSDLNYFQKEKVIFMRIMTSNIWGDYFNNPVELRQEGLLNVFKKYSPDVLGLQEVTKSWYESKIFKELCER